MCLPIVVRHPGRLLASGTHAGHEWAVTHNGNGYRCGYVKVPPGHPWYGKGYNDLESVEVHGGLTFAEADTPCDSGGPDDGWWVGFDCAHGGDDPDPDLPNSTRDKYRNAFDGLRLPFMEAMMEFSDDACARGLPGLSDVRTQEYVENECRKVCEQAAAG